ncbi:MAG: ornithine cyclodeaminase family protein [Anaerolineae bacterium]|nr:ornithine cyclodeaminase family protein [Anaerolineae bacterium]
MRLLVLSQSDVRRALPMRDAVEAMKRAFAQLSTGQAEVPLRVPLPVPRHNGLTLFMPAYLAADDQMAVKIVSVFNDNPARSLPLIHALVVVIDAETGMPVAAMEGASLTALRTGAASGAATDLLARPDAAVVAVFGAGAQGRTQLEGVCAVRPIREARVYDVDPRRAREYAQEMQDRLGIPVRIAASPAEAVRQADVVCTATTSSTPVLDDADIGPGTHINAIGAYTPQMREVPTETVLRARVVVDHRAASLAEAGDLLIPIREGRMTEGHIWAELGEIAAGLKPGRTSPEEVTLFKSVGVAVQDVAAAAAVLEAARRQNLGVEVSL